jgi:hypothetical protein
MALESKDARNNPALAHAALGDFSRARLNFDVPPMPLLPSIT